MPFIGRTEELKKLNKQYKEPGATATLIYGRRRVGKSELIKHFLQVSAIQGLYYECKQTTQENNVSTLSNLYAEQVNLPPFAFSSTEDLLDYLFRTHTDKPYVLVLDEYPYLRQVTPGLDSILQTLLDTYKHTSQLKLIICGSFVDTMKSLLLTHNPLYGRFSLSIHLKAMDYYESAQFYPTFTNEDKIRLYSVFGGIPYYNQLINPALSVKDNIIELLASPNARLESEVQLYLQGELSKFTNANEVFETLAKGISKYKDILDQSHVSSNPALADVLKRLLLMEMIHKETPINDSKNKRRTAYYISDNMSLFYYRYIFRYASPLRIMNSDAFYTRYIEKDFEETYVPKRFEHICRQFLIRQNRQGLLNPIIDAIGTYSYDLPTEHRNGEFDVVTHDDKGYINYEVKFRNKPISQTIIEKERSQMQTANLPFYSYGFFSRSGYTTNALTYIKNTQGRAYTLDDLYQ